MNAELLAFSAAIDEMIARHAAYQRATKAYERMAWGRVLWDMESTLRHLEEKMNQARGRLGISHVRYQQTWEALVEAHNATAADNQLPLSYESVRGSYAA